VKYLIVNNTTFDAFYQTAQSAAQAAGPLSISYVERADADGKDIPGGWGCIRFQNAMPGSALFNAPDVEYRYSEEQDAWLADGATTQYSEWIKTLFQYFLSALWWDL